MSVIHFQLKEVLFDLEAALRGLTLWDDTPPSADAFASELPFCVDKMEFYQWLQFVLVPRCYQLVEQQTSLALGAAISPMAETVYPKDQRHEALFIALEKIDILLKKPEVT